MRNASEKPVPRSNLIILRIEMRLRKTLCALLAALLLVLVGACERTPAPMVDRNIERGTALPPPGLAEAPRR